MHISEKKIYGNGESIRRCTNPVRRDLTTMQYSAWYCDGRWWWWASDIQRYHPRIYCSVKPGRQLGYKLVLYTARTATSRFYTIRPLCMYNTVYTYARTSVPGPPTRYTSLVCLCSWQLRGRTLPILVLNLMIGQLRATFPTCSRRGRS